jgi:hypothetical protein
MTKTCSVCNIEKDLSCFGKRKRSKGGYRSECKDCRKIYYENNIVKIKISKKTHYENNKVYIKEHNKKYLNNKRENNPVFRQMVNVSRQILTGLQKQKSSKNGKSCWKKLPYTPKEITQHLENLFESWMTWNNYGRYVSKTWDDNDPTTWKWQIDHIIPHSKLPYDSMDHPNFIKCWTLDNLRPLSAKQNVIDGNRRF